MGTIEKRGNSWRVGVQVYDEEGKRRWIRRSLKFNAAMSVSQQRRQAEKALRQLEVDVENGKARPDSSMTVRDLAALWMRRHVDANLSPVTAANYQHMLDCRILPKLGDIPVDKLTTAMLADFMAQIKAEGRITTRKDDAQLKKKARRPSDVAKLSADPGRPLSGRTLASYYDVLDTMLDHAVKWEIHGERGPAHISPPAREVPGRRSGRGAAAPVVRRGFTVISVRGAAGPHMRPAPGRSGRADLGGCRFQALQDRHLQSPEIFRPVRLIRRGDKDGGQ